MINVCLRLRQTASQLRKPDSTQRVLCFEMDITTEKLQAYHEANGSTQDREPPTLMSRIQTIINAPRIFNLKR